MLHLDGVSVRQGDTVLLDRVDWRIEPGQHWVVLGPNGSGKSTLLRLAALQLHPSEGAVHVLGATLGRTDTRMLRRRIGYAAAALAEMGTRRYPAPGAVGEPPDDFGAPAIACGGTGAHQQPVIELVEIPLVQ